MADFKSIILPEDPAPSYAIQCQNCELAKHRNRVIWGEGYPDAPIFILLDNPGAREDREGNAYVCGTRDTLQHGLYEAGINIKHVYVSYILKCRPMRAYDKPFARNACAPYWQSQVEEKQPECLVGLGNVVAQTLLLDPAAEVKQLRGAWHDVQGIPCAFSYHPLAVRRRPVLMKYFVEDLKRVADKVKKMLK